MARLGFVLNIQQNELVQTTVTQSRSLKHFSFALNVPLCHKTNNFGSNYFHTKCYYSCNTSPISLQTPQSPLVRPAAHDEFAVDNYALGTNAVVAVISYTVSETQFSLWLSDGSRPADSGGRGGGGGHPDPEIREGGRSGLQKNFFAALRVSVRLSLL